MRFGPADKITIIGKSGCGKSTLCRRLHESGIWPRVVVFDRMGEYDPAGFSAAVKGFDNFARAVADFAAAPKFRLLYRFDLESTGHDEEFNQALRVLFYLGHVCVVVEETWNFSSKHYLPQWYREILLTGRHAAVALISTSQRPAEMHKTVFSQSQHVFCGQSFETNDIKYLANFIGRENSARLSALKIGEFLHYSPGAAPAVVSNKK